MKRILSILLVLAMLLSMIPAVFAADCDITVSTPAPDPVKVGALYQLPLGTVFTDPNGHALSFALKADYGDKVYIKDNTLQEQSVQVGVKMAPAPNCHCEEAAGRRGNLGKALPIRTGCR